MKILFSGVVRLPYSLILVSLCNCCVISLIYLFLLPCFLFSNMRISTSSHSRFLRTVTNNNTSADLKNSITTIIIMQVRAVVLKRNKKHLNFLSKHCAKKDYSIICIRHFLWINSFNIHSNSGGRQYFIIIYNFTPLRK